MKKNNPETPSGEKQEESQLFPTEKSKDNSKSEKDLGEILDLIPEESRTSFIQLIEKTHSGPLPSPEALAHYEEICEGAAERILKMAEKEQAHRHKGDEQILFSRPKYLNRGQLFAFTIGLSGIAGSVIVALTSGPASVSIALGAGPAIALAAGFIGRSILGSSKQHDSKSKDSES